MAFTLPDLPYAYDALSPHMSAETLEFHHDKHHQAYVTNGNNLLKDSGLDGKSLEEVVKQSFGKNAGLFNNAAQHYNHNHFWKWMKKDGGGKSLPARLQKAIDSDLGGYDKFRADFIAAGVGQFGSGWCWIALKDGKLSVMKTPNGENPLVHGGKPILALPATARDGTVSRIDPKGERYYLEDAQIEQEKAKARQCGGTASDVRSPSSSSSVETQPGTVST